MTIQYSIKKIPALSPESHARNLSLVNTISNALLDLEDALHGHDALDTDTAVVGSIGSTLRQIRNTLIGNPFMKLCFVELNMLYALGKILQIRPEQAIKFGLLEWQIHALVIVGTIVKMCASEPNSSAYAIISKQIIELDIHASVWELLIRYTQQKVDCPDIATMAWRVLRILYRASLASCETPFKVYLYSYQ